MLVVETILSWGAIIFGFIGVALVPSVGGRGVER
jgi:hypothetical protein